MSKAQTLSAADRAKLEGLIGHDFAEKERLDRALTHASARTEKGGNYERLEFLGDRVLGLCIAELLFRTFERREKASSRFASTSSSALKPAPRSPTNSIFTSISAPAPM